MKRNIETSDLTLAAFLKLNGFKLDYIEKRGKQSYFCFVDVLNQKLEEFNAGKSLVEPMAYDEAFKALAASIKRN